jgi:hypothetical protein
MQRSLPSDYATAAHKLILARRTPRMRCRVRGRLVAPRSGYKSAMSTSSLTHQQTVPADRNERERLHAFATAMAQRDRSRHRRPLRDADIERAIRGYAYAAAMAEHRALTLTGDDIDEAISAYRDARRLPSRHEPAQRALIAFADGGPVHRLR